MNPLISIIIPVYNVQDKLQFCVSSVLNQTYKNLQIILVDDGSTDNSGKLCDELAETDSRITVIHTINGGQSAARSVGLKEAEGEYIGFVDSDDWIHPQMYEYLLKLIIEYGADVSTAAIIKTKKETFDRPEAEEKITVYSREDYAKKFFKIGSQEIVYYIYNRLYKKNIISDCVIPEGILIGEDVLITYRMLLKTQKIVESNIPVYFYRLSSGITANFNENYFQLIEVWDKVEKMAEKVSAQEHQYALINQARINFTILSELAIAGKYNDKKYIDKRDALIKRLKNNKKVLLDADISSSRKLMIRWFTIHYKSAAFMLHKFIKKRQ